MRCQTGSLKADGSGGLSEEETLAQKLTLAVIERRGHNTNAELEAVNKAIGHQQAIAALMLIGRYVTHAFIVNSLNLAEAINVLERGLLAEARGDAQNMVKTHATWDKGSTLHAIGAVFAKDGFAGTKTWAHTEGGATPLLILFDSDNGSLKAVIEAFALGQMRTGAAM